MRSLLEAGPGGGLAGSLATIESAQGLGARVAAYVEACAALYRKSPRIEAETETYRGQRRAVAACGGCVYLVSGCGWTPEGSARGALSRGGGGRRFGTRESGCARWAGPEG